MIRYRITMENDKGSLIDAHAITIESKGEVDLDRKLTEAVGDYVRTITFRPGDVIRINLLSADVKANASFLDWWKELDAQLQHLGHEGCGLQDARTAYDLGKTPAAGARALIKLWKALA
jgi:hypothetical protein